jgi:RimJ/RimL family protein N-acetyltransferase
LSKPHVEPISGEKVRLRLLAEADLPLTLGWRNQAQIRRWFFYSELITPAQHEKWFKNYLERDDDFVFVIETVAAPIVAVGQVALYNVDRAGGRAEYGRLMIGEGSVRGQGLAAAATALILDFAARQLQLREVYLEVYSHNGAARRVYEQCGFAVTATAGDVTQMSIALPAGLEP